jgi:hypothetical protein
MHLTPADGMNNLDPVTGIQPVNTMRTARHDLQIYLDGQAPIHQSHIFQQLCHRNSFRDSASFTVYKDLHKLTLSFIEMIGIDPASRD